MVLNENTDLMGKMGKDDIRREIIEGLTSVKKYISSKFFYDEVGSTLFEEITRLPEYYLTRTEKSILKKVALKFRDQLKNVDIIELGSGDCSKISIFLEAIPDKSLKKIRYIPVDVSQAAIEKSTRILLENFSEIEIKGVVADLTEQLKLFPGNARRIFCFFGSTIGNFTPTEIDRLMDNLSKIMQSGDMLLLGVDRVKNKDILEKAYNDPRDITAKFNRNILNTVNNLIETNFKPMDFEHVAFYNEKKFRIEMHLKANKDLEISSPYLTDKIIMKKGETIHTENSYKFTDKDIYKLALASGLRIKNIFTDENKWFSIIQFYKSGRGSPCST